jgi:hypothetical protein
VKLVTFVRMLHSYRKLTSELPSYLLLSLSGRVQIAPPGILLTVTKTSVQHTVVNNGLPHLTYCELFC